MTWYPVSAPKSFTQNLYNDDDNDFMTLSSNVSVGFQGPGGNSSVATFAIPYTSLYRVLPTTYNGTTFHGGNTRVKQFNHTGFGEIFVTGLEDVKHRVLIRMKRAELYCPRFIQALTTVAPSLADTKLPWLGP